MARAKEGKGSESTTLNARNEKVVPPFPRPRVIRCLRPLPHAEVPVFIVVALQPASGWKAAHATYGDSFASAPRALRKSARCVEVESPGGWARARVFAPCYRSAMI